MFEEMIDKATGHDKAMSQAFVNWFNENVWGPSPTARSTEHPRS